MNQCKVLNYYFDEVKRKQNISMQRYSLSAPSCVNDARWKLHNIFEMSFREMVSALILNIFDIT